MRKFLLAALIVAGSVFTLGSTQQVRYPSQVPQSGQTNAAAQNARDDAGLALLDLLGASCGTVPYGGCYAGLTITAVSGSLNVTVNANATTGGRVYEQVASNPNPMPASTPTPPSPATPVPAATLAPDTTQVIVHGDVAPSATSAPLAVPCTSCTSGQAIYYLIEAKVTSSTPSSPSVTTFFNAAFNALWTTNQNLQNVDTIAYTAKAGTAAVSPAIPSLDAGDVALGTVLVPYGATSCVTSCTIAQYTVLGGVAILNFSNTWTTGQTVTGYVNVNSASASYEYLGTPIANGIPSLSDWFFGSAGNLSMTGNYNMASGKGALQSNTTGSGNMASGFQTLYFNTTGSNNTASGASALLYNTTGSGNMASGQGALLSNTTGSNNTASGQSALYSNTTGSNNTASGQNALYSNTTGSNNMASGKGALQSNTSGWDNTEIGSQPDAAAYACITTGSQNILIGFDVCGGLTNSVNGQLNIGNAIFGVNNISTQNTLSTGCIMLYSASCPTGVALYVNGPMAIPAVVTQNKGQTSCPLSASTSCAVTATVISGATCTVTYDHSSTVTLADLLPVTEGVSGTTLTLYGSTTLAVTGTIYFDYLCF